MGREALAAGSGACACALALLWALQVQAQPGMYGGGRGAIGERFGRSPPGEAGVPRPSGLRAAFSPDVQCPAIASPFGSRTRHDGSARTATEFGGFHGGIDISLAEGTQLLALAAGSVAAKGDGGLREGAYLWLRHAPGDTGLPDWVYSKYQHLAAVPELRVGDRVALGQVIARSGSSGTAGGHYGAAGYPHLHLGTGRSPGGDAVVGARGEARNLRLVDPLVLFAQAGAPAAAGEVAVPHATGDGAIVPAGSRLVWPVACRAR